MNKDHEAYLEYYDTHREEFGDEPIRAICGTMEMRVIARGGLTVEDSKKQAFERRTKWECYHLAKAEALGFMINLDRLVVGLSALARELRAMDREKVGVKGAKK